MITRFTELDQEKYKARLLAETLGLDYSRSVSQELHEALKSVVGVAYEKIILEIEAFKAILPPSLRFLSHVLQSKSVKHTYKCAHDAEWRVAYQRFTDAIIAIKGDEKETRPCIICRTLYGYLAIPSSEFQDFFGEGADIRNILYYYNPLTGKKRERSFIRENELQRKSA